MMKCHHPTFSTDTNEALKDKVKDLLKEIEGDPSEVGDTPAAEGENIPGVKVEPKPQTPVDVAVKTPPKPKAPDVKKEVEKDTPVKVEEKPAETKKQETYASGSASPAAKKILAEKGIATSIGHSPISGLINPIAGSRNSITEALTNIIWAPLKDGLQSVSLSANWMWPCKNEGEDARLYEAVKAISEFSIDLGINVPTGKDSLSMKQKYPDGDVISPGTVIISAAANCNEISKVILMIGLL